jgi:hypothetical protein
MVVAHRPRQTALVLLLALFGEQLIKIFTTGEKPVGGAYNSPFLRSAPMPDCIYKSFHSLQMTDDEEQGIVWKLRSIAPRAMAELDFGRRQPK